MTVTSSVPVPITVATVIARSRSGSFPFAHRNRRRRSDPGSGVIPLSLSSCLRLNAFTVCFSRRQGIPRRFHLWALKLHLSDSTGPRSCARRIGFRPEPVVGYLRRSSLQFPSDPPRGSCSFQPGTYVHLGDRDSGACHVESPGTRCNSKKSVSSSHLSTTARPRTPIWHVGTTAMDRSLGIQRRFVCQGMRRCRRQCRWQRRCDRSWESLEVLGPLTVHFSGPLQN
jgi:hypothetical protein